MAMRITSGYLTRHFLTNLGNTAENQARLQEQLSSGRRVNRPSDDPFAVAKSLGLEQQLEKIDQYRRNISFSQGFVDTSEAALADATSTLSRIRELVVQAGNDTNDQSALNSIALEVVQLKESVRQAANTRFGDQYVFSGTATLTEPFPSPGNAYAGTTPPDDAINRRIDENSTVQINRDGETVFGPGGANVLDLIDTIVTDLQTGLPANRNNLRTADLNGLDGFIDSFLQTQAAFGSMASRLEVTDNKLQDMEIRTADSLSSLVDTDVAKAAMELTTQNTLYESALLSGSRMLQTSLADFLM